MTEQALAAKGIFSNWIARDYQNKRTYNITTNSVAINTIRSAKGFDYAYVFLVGLDSVDEAFLINGQFGAYPFRADEF